MPRNNLSVGELRVYRQPFPCLRQEPRCLSVPDSQKRPEVAVQFMELFVLLLQQPATRVVFRHLLS